MTRTLTLKSTEPQAEFLALTCKYPLFVGGFGSGKTETMVNAALIDVSYSSKAVVALYAPTYDLVKLILVPRILEKLASHGMQYELNKTDNVINILEPGFGSFILRTLDKPERIVGYESFRAHVDELDILPKNKAEAAWNKIIARNRMKLVEAPTAENRVSAYTTPEGFRFAHYRWVEAGGDDYQRVHAASYSNPMLPDDYISSLKSTYPAELIDAYIEGAFTNLNGGTVYNAFNRKAHNSKEVIKPKETLYIGCDFNVTKQAATVYVKRNGGKEWHAVHEYVDMYDTPEMIQMFHKDFPDHKIVVYPDASGAGRSTSNASTSDIALLKQAGFEVRVKKQNPRVKDRILAMNAALTHSKVFINVDACPRVVECLEQQAYNDKGEPDKTSGNDHQNDATTYPIAYELPIRKPVAQINASFFTHT